MLLNAKFQQDLPSLAPTPELLCRSQPVPQSKDTLHQKWNSSENRQAKDAEIKGENCEFIGVVRWKAILAKKTERSKNKSIDFQISRIKLPIYERFQQRRPKASPPRPIKKNKPMEKMVRKGKHRDLPGRSSHPQKIAKNHLLIISDYLYPRAYNIFVD